MSAPARLVLRCACGTAIVGRGYIDANNPPSADGPRLCRSCAADHVRERPGDLAQAPGAQPDRSLT